MSKMKAIFALALLPAVGLTAVCAKCERIREERAEHPDNWEYYDDYLEHKRKLGEEVTEEQYDFSENDNPRPRDR